MMQGMLAKGEAMKTQEKVEFAKFKVYCDTTRKDTQKAIETGADNIVQQTAAIGKALSDAEALAEDIKDVQADTAKMENQLAEATSVQKKEGADYEAMHKDFTE